MIAIESFAASVAMPAAAREVGGLSLYGWVFSAFFLSMVAAMAMAGSLASRGAHRPFWLGNILFALGLFVAGTSSDIRLILSARALQGFGSGFASAATYAIVSVSFAPEIRARMIALISSAYAIPALIGPAWAVFVTEQYGWRWVFLVLAPFPLLSMFMIKRVPGDSSVESNQTRSLMYPALLLGSGIALISMGITLFTQGQTFAIGLMLPGVPFCFLGLRGLISRRGSMFRRIFASMLLLNVGFFGIDAILPLLLQITRHGNLFLAGFALTAAAIAWITASWIQSKLLERLGRRAFVTAGALLTIFGIVVTAVSFSPAWPEVLSIIGWGIAGGGMGFASNTLSLLGMEQADGRAEDVAIIQLSGVIGMAVGTALSGAFIGSVNDQSELSGFRIVLMCAVLVLAIFPLPFLAIRFSSAQKATIA
ncbi:MAG: MFS transporter [Spirochaetia bacterium]|nr:MFS transporter [Spirochaetia bacterium]